MREHVTLHVEAGAGGAGSAHLKHERYAPRGGPDGGDGGSGGSVILLGDSHVETLGDLRSSKIYKAAAGKPGGPEGKHGSRGIDIVLRVPLGTKVYLEDESLLGEIEESGQKLILVRGGRGGRGNRHFKTSVHQTPRFAEQGLPGETGTFTLEIASSIDVVLVGFPNAGKSSLLAAMTNATPAVGAYAFTTVEPERGVVERNYEQILIEELPGLLEESENVELGPLVLQHALRAHVLVLVISGEEEQIATRVRAFKKMLDGLQQGLSRRVGAVVVTKIDLAEVSARKSAINRSLGRSGVPAHFISSVTGEGVPVLVEDLFVQVKEARAAEAQAEPNASEEIADFRPGENEWGAGVRREKGVFVLEGPTIPVLVVNPYTPQHDVEMWLRERLRRSRWRQRLERAGVKAGDKVRVGEVELEW